MSEVGERKEGVRLVGRLNKYRDKFKVSFSQEVTELQTIDLSRKSPCLHPLFHPPYPFFQWYPQSNEILLNLNMKCWNSAFNAEGSSVIIVVVQVGALKIYVAAVEALTR
jgi:hypothetical protein